MTKVINCYQAPTQQSSRGKKINLKKFNLFLVFCISLLGVCYLVNASDLAVKGFALKELKAQAEVLASEKLDNEEQINNLQSYYSLSTRAQKLNMVAIGEIEYLSAIPSVVARK